MLLRKKEEIEAWLEKYEIQDYQLIKDEKYGYVVNVFEFINLSNKGLKSIDVKFNEIKSSLICNYNELESFEGFPEKILIGLHIGNNKFTSLKGCTKEIGEYFNCSNNDINIEELEDIFKIKSCQYIDLTKNEKLGNLQNIKNIIELKEIFNIKEEKENILNLINSLNYEKKNIINKI